MEVRAFILQYPDSPGPATFQHQLTLQRLMTDVKRFYERITLRQLNYDPRAMPEIIAMPSPMRPSLRQSMTGLGGGKGGVANEGMSWWDAEGVLRTRGYRTEDTLLFAIHHGVETDGSGLGQPDWRTHQDVRWNDQADPDVGGLATTGFRNIAQPLAQGWEGRYTRLAVNIAAHELGHALGRHHTNGNPRGVLEMISSVMGYGHGYAAYGHGMPANQLSPADRAALDPDENGYVYFDPKAALPVELATWRRHAAFSDLPETGTSHTPGLLDDLVALELNDALWAQNHIDEETSPNRFSERRARLTWGGLTKELSER